MQVLKMAGSKENTRVRLLMLHGFTMLMLGMLLFYARETMQFFYAFGCALAMLLIAASLILLAVLDWICVVGQGPEQASKLQGFLMASVGAATGGVVMALYPGATIRMFCYLIAVYTLLLSFGKYQLARRLNFTGRVRVTLIALAAIAFLFGIVLLLVAGWDERMVITVLGFYSSYMGIQMLLSMFYLHESLESLGPEAGSKTH
jgi:uncharacterized membrane protein HdeD (DUF308 family)